MNVRIGPSRLGVCLSYSLTVVSCHLDLEHCSEQSKHLVQFWQMNKSHQIISGACQQSENPKFLVMIMLDPLMIKTEITCSFYKYKYLVDGSNKIKKRTEKMPPKNVSGGVFLLKYY